MSKTAKKSPPKKAAAKKIVNKPSSKKTVKIAKDEAKKAPRKVGKSPALAAPYDPASAIKVGDPYVEVAGMIDPKQAKAIGLATMPTQAQVELPPFENKPPKRRRDLMGDEPPPPAPAPETFDGAFLRAVMDQLKFMGDKHVSTMQEAEARGFDIDALNVAFAFYKLSPGTRKIAAGYLTALL